MAKTTPSGRAKSKTPATKKKPTQLDRIERSIGLIESKLATLYAWERLEEAMSNDKLASPTVAVEDEPAEGDYVRIVRVQHESLGRIYTVQKVRPQHLGWLLSNDCWYAKANLEKLSPEEIAAHEAKLKAEAQAAEDAKLVFGARVKWNDNSPHTVLGRSPHDPIYWLLWCPKFPVQVQEVRRNEFTLLP